jgi:hypothetical protein
MLRVYGQSGDIHNTLIILKGSKERGPSDLQGGFRGSRSHREIERGDF